MPLSAALAAWITSQACGATFDHSLAASTCIALSTIGASLYHYGAANWMYTRKNERLQFRNPRILILSGLLVFCFSAAIAVMWLNKACVYICLFNAMAVGAYSTKLSTHWSTKNLTMAAVLTTPTVIGWQAGNFTHPITPWCVLISTLALVAREMIKDVQDIQANHGRRVTLPMVLGIRSVLCMAGALLLASSIPALCMLKFTGGAFHRNMILASVAILLLTAGQLIVFKQPARSQTAITLALLCAVGALL